jgi:hypothetical protein
MKESSKNRREKMPALSKSQRRFFGAMMAYKAGDLPNASPSMKKAAAGMTDKQVEEFASTKEKGLPMRSNNALLNGGHTVTRAAKARMKRRMMKK